MSGSSNINTNVISDVPLHWENYVSKPDLFFRRDPTVPDNV